MRVLFKIYTICSTVFAVYTHISFAEPDHALVYQLKGSVTKVHATTKQGGHSVGTGVVIASDIVATNCHILTDAVNVSVSKMGESISPVAISTDWTHDICLLKFQYLNLPAVPTRATSSLRYGEEVFSIGFPGGPPKPQTSIGKIRALYPYDDGLIVRTDAAFIMGASGSPIFTSKGELIALSTFKSPGRHAYYYGIPVEWIQRLSSQPEKNMEASVPFWNRPEGQRPFLMQVVQPYMEGDWVSLEKISRNWTDHEPDTAEAYFYLASGLHGQGQLTEAQKAYEKCIALQPLHTDALQGLAILEKQTGQLAQFDKTNLSLKNIDEESWRILQNRIKELQ